MNEKDIRELHKHYRDTIYPRVRRQQETDKTYIEDTFEIKGMEEEDIVRQGLGYKIINSAAEHLVTSNPQVFFESKNTETVEHLSKLVNNGWLPSISRGNPYVLKEFVKNLLKRGEAYLYITHNERWVTGKEKDRELARESSLPVHFLAPDPMIVYGAPPRIGDEGVPDNVIVSYPRAISDVIQLYPDFKSKRRNRLDTNVNWLMYIDKDIVYYEADGQPLLGGIRPNIYGFVPFLRAFSGFGSQSADWAQGADMSDLIVSDLRFERDLIKDFYRKRSQIATTTRRFTHPYKDLFIPLDAQGNMPKVDADKLRETYDAGVGAFNVVEGVNPEWLVQGNIITPPPELFADANYLEATIKQRFPFLNPRPLGTSGRQDDLASTDALKHYDTVMDNTENSFAAGIKMALDILNRVPTLKPDGIREEDLTRKFFVKVELREKDPVEEDRKITLGHRLRDGGIIDLETLHTDYMGMTQAKSKEVQAKILVDQLMLQPDVMAAMAMVYAEETGMTDLIEQARNRAQLMGEGKKTPATTTERVQGEVQTPTGREQGTQPNRGARAAPAAFDR